MKMLFVICEAAFDSHIMQGLAGIGVPGYTRFTGAIGNGRSGAREGTPVWPGLNSMIVTCVPEAMVPEVTALIAKLDEERQGRLVVKVFATDATQIA